MLPVHKETRERFNPVKGRGRLPVKDSVETREGLIVIKMTDSHVW